jgi:hypothetical protein
MGCDPNSEPTYGESTGPPKNCRAIVQQNIDAYRAKQYSADEIMNSLERNCGEKGYSWGKLSTPPDGALRRVFKHDTSFCELFTDTVSISKILSLLRIITLHNQSIDIQHIVSLTL